MHSVSGTGENSQAHPLYEEALFVSGCTVEPMALESLNRTSKQWEETSFNDIFKTSPLLVRIDNSTTVKLTARIPDALESKEANE
jgi:hypothetical protein